MYLKSITKDEVNELPLFSFDGKIVTAFSPEQIDQAIDELGKAEIVGFDTETRPTFKKGQFHHVALIQLAVSGKAYIFLIQKSGLTDRLIAFFENPRIKKVGIAIHDDLIALKKKRMFSPAGFVDLNKMAEQMGFENIGARNLTAMVLNKRISKSQQRSNWENIPLTPRQIQYAATDAWICQEIYHRLQKMDRSGKK